MAQQLSAASCAPIHAGGGRRDSIDAGAVGWAVVSPKRFIADVVFPCRWTVSSNLLERAMRVRYAGRQPGSRRRKREPPAAGRLFTSGCPDVPVGPPYGRASAGAVCTSRRWLNPRYVTLGSVTGVTYAPGAAASMAVAVAAVRIAVAQEPDREGCGNGYG